MTQSSQTVPAASVLTETGQVRAGVERLYALNKLKRDPDNVRKGGHSDAVVEQRAASILSKGLIHLPVVRPERRPDGTETGYAFVTAGEGRRLALRLLAKRKRIPKTAPVRCLVDEHNRAADVSLDENFSREPLHPADEFEAFRALAQDEGWGAEAIAARYGVTAAAVRQRLRLSAVAPVLIARYRDGDLTLDQLMAFTVSENHARQLQVFEAYPHAHPSAIRRAMTETSAQADDRRVCFVGVEAYVAAGGVIERDLFTEDRGGYLTDVALLDQLVAAKLDDAAADVLAAEGWKWAETRLTYPHGHGLSRVWPQTIAVSPERQAQRDAYDALSGTWGGIEDLPAEVEAELAALEAVLEGDVREAYEPDDLARAGVFVILGHDGQLRLERGLVRPEDVRRAAETSSEGDDEAAMTGDGDEDGMAQDTASDAPEDDRAPLSAKLIADLTAHRTAGLRLALANDPDLALVALTHGLVLCTFQGHGRNSCLTVQAVSTDLAQHAQGLEANAAYEAMDTRYDQWAKQMPQDPKAVWDFVVGLDHDSRASLLAFCVGNSLDAVKSFSGRGAALEHAETLATASGLDMTAFWTPTEGRYLGRVSKSHVLAAVEEAVSPETAGRLAGLKKADLITAAEPDLVKARWLPPLLRTRPRTADAPEGETSDAAPHDQGAEALATTQASGEDALIAAE